MWLGRGWLSHGEDERIEIEIGRDLLYGIIMHFENIRDAQVLPYTVIPPCLSLIHHPVNSVILLTIRGVVPPACAIIQS